jgi:hypothetical protein
MALDERGMKDRALRLRRQSPARAASGFRNVGGIRCVASCAVAARRTAGRR